MHINDAFFLQQSSLKVFFFCHLQYREWGFVAIINCTCGIVIAQRRPDSFMLGNAGTILDKVNIQAPGSKHKDHTHRHSLV